MKLLTPVAQSFFIDKDKFPDGITLLSICLFFRRRDEENFPITLDLRPLVNGYPDNKTVYPYSEVTLPASAVKTKSGISSDIPLNSDPNSWTKFSFRAPIILLPGSHCFCLSTNSSKYELFTSKLGDRSLIDDKLVVSRHEYSEVMFRSSNSATFSAEQSENLMYQINIARFDISKFGGIMSESVESNKSVDMTKLSGSNEYQLFNITNSDAQPNETKINYFISHTPFPVFGQEEPRTDWAACLVNQNISLPKSMFVSNDNFGSDPQIQMLSVLQTRSSYVTPIVDQTLSSINLVNNYTSDGMISDKRNFPISNGGTGYAPTVNITTAGGSGAVCHAILRDGVVTRICVTAGGTGYSADDLTLAASVTGAGGSGCVLGTPVISSGAIVSIPIVDGGSGYGPYITATGPDFEWGIPLVFNGLCIGLDPEFDGPYSEELKTKINSSAGSVIGYNNKTGSIGTGYANTPKLTINNEGTGYGLIINPEEFEDQLKMSPNNKEYTPHLPGTSTSRYITKVIKMNYNADNIRVILDLNRPENTDIKIYIKPHHIEDPNELDNNDWKEILNKGDLPKHKVPSLFNEVEYHLNNIKYSSYSGFDSYRLKIVMYSKSPVNVPRIRNLRVIALK